MTIFQKILNGDIPADEVYQDEDVFAFRDINPQAPVHILIIPRKPVSSVAELAPEDEGLAGKLMLVAAKIASKLGLDDYRLVINNGSGAGQSVFHLHVHLLGGRPLTWPPG